MNLETTTTLLILTFSLLIREGSWRGLHQIPGFLEATVGEKNYQKRNIYKNKKEKHLFGGGKNLRKKYIKICETYFSELGKLVALAELMDSAVRSVTK